MKYKHIKEAKTLIIKKVKFHNWAEAVNLCKFFMTVYYGDTDQKQQCKLIGTRLVYILFYFGLFCFERSYLNLRVYITIGTYSS